MGEDKKLYKVSTATYLLVSMTACVVFSLPVVYSVIDPFVKKTSVAAFIDNSNTASRVLASTANTITNINSRGTIEFLNRSFLSDQLVYIDIVYRGKVYKPSSMKDHSLQFIEDQSFDQNSDDVYFVSRVIRNRWEQNDQNSENFLRLGFSERSTKQKIRILTGTLVGFFGGLSFLGVIIFTSMIMNLIKPFTRLIKKAESISHGSIQEPVTTSAPIIELGSLALSLEKIRRSLIQQSDALERMSNRDELTGIPNRMVLSDSLDNAVRTGERTKLPFSLMVIDLDNFKEINDTLGHHAGDAVLKEAALRLYGSIRKGDTAARMSGDEFGVLFYGANREDLESRCQAIAKVIKEPYKVEGVQIKIGISIGVAGYLKDGIGSAEIIRRAGVAMYHAKKAGIDYFFYDHNMDADNIQMVELKRQVSGIMDRNELVLYYQPKVNLVTGTVDSFEALVRWQHPEEGLVPPDKFIPLIEQSDLIHELTFWVLNRAMKDCQQWRNTGYAVEPDVAVNITPKSLELPNLTLLIDNLIDEQGFNPDRLELELTENDLVKDHVAAVRILEEISATGIRIAIDDFGTGYSSLAYLKKLPIDSVKIDKSFIIDLKGDDDTSAIVQATIDMAHNLGIKVTAEGVENEYALKNLREWECDYGQGYLFSKPLRHFEVITFLRLWDPKKYFKDL